MAILALSLFMFMVAINTLPGTDSTPTMTCPVSFVKRGCYKDEEANRRLPELLLDERYDIDWKDWNTFIQNFICKCAKETQNKGYKYFGIQFYAECWSGDVTEAMMLNMETNDKNPGGCVNNVDLDNCTSESEMCAGKDLANYVYVIDCSDKDDKCQQWKQFNLCDEKYPDVLKQCPKSCDLCSK